MNLKWDQIRDLLTHLTFQCIIVQNKHQNTSERYAEWRNSLNASQEELFYVEMLKEHKYKYSQCLVLTFLSSDLHQDLHQIVSACDRRRARLFNPSTVRHFDLTLLSERLSGVVSDGCFFFLIRPPLSYTGCYIN